MINEYLKLKLSFDKQELYKKMYNALSMHKSRVECKGYSDQDIFDAYMALYNDHPEMFYLSNMPQLEKMFGFMGSISTLISEPIFSREEIGKLESKINEVKNQISRSLVGASDERKKELIIVNYLLENTTYEINNKYNQNAATVLVKNKGQCSGIAKAVKLLCDYIGIECLVIEGTGRDTSTGTSGPHAWNIVKIEGKYYHLDVTFMIGANLDKKKPFRYLYFNGSDVEFQKNHTWQKDKYPKCVTSWVSGSEGLPVQPSYKSAETTSESLNKIITSMFFFRYEIGKLIDEKGRKLVFISKIKNQETSNIADLYLKEVVKVATAKNVSVSINVSSKGEEITITLNWK